MAFENIDVLGLRKSINSCINSINYDTTNNIITNISNNNVWQTESRNNLKKALQTLTNTRYKDLKNYLNKCLTIVGYIEKYKEEELKIKNYQSQISTLNSQIAEAESRSQTYTICRGDSLWRISQKYGVSMYDIADINGFRSINDTIYAGQTLIIPGGSTVNTAELSSQINNLKNKISQSRKEMERLESKVSNSI